MELFSFALSPLNEIEPWLDSDGNSTLSWYGLSLGNYQINVNDQTLFEYSDEFIRRYFSNEEAQMSNSRFMHYNVSRLYEDLLYLLPYATQKIPSELTKLIENSSAEGSWRSSMEMQPDFTFEEYISDAEEWWRLRHLQGMGGDPSICMYRDENEIVIRWNCMDAKVENVYRWAATHGQLKMGLTCFRDQVQSFFRRFHDQMSERVQFLSCKPELAMQMSVDIDSLVEENRYRLKRMSQYEQDLDVENDWNKVLEANRSLGIQL